MLYGKKTCTQIDSPKPPTCVVNTFENPEHLNQDQVMITTLRVTPRPSNSPLNSCSDASADVATPASTNSPTTTVNDKDEPHPP